MGCERGRYDVYLEVRKREKERIKEGLTPRIHFLDEDAVTEEAGHDDTQVRPGSFRFFLVMTSAACRHHREEFSMSEQKPEWDRDRIGDLFHAMEPRKT